MRSLKWSLIAFAAIGLAACSEPASSQGSSGQMNSGGAGGDSGQGGAAGASSSSGSTGGQGGQGGQGSIQPSCYVGTANCNPLTNAGCTQPGEACDYGTVSGKTGLHCFPPPNDVLEGQTCGPHGPYCAPTLHCFGVCKKFCCADSECVQGESCVAFDDSLGTLGFCRDPNVCSPPGGPCQMAADCCSMDCHNGHCH
jgi:hypothetical protein